MTHVLFITRTALKLALDAPHPQYKPGACNIGPAEISMRRRAGHLGLLATIAALFAFAALGSPHLVRLVVALPAAAAASGYLQAWLKFCAAFGSRGLFNFGSRGGARLVADPGARQLDRQKAGRIALASLVIGLTVALTAALLPF